MYNFATNTTTRESSLTRPVKWDLQLTLTNRYGKQGLIGGICGFWCPHGIAVGIHFMPDAEGRDDVFSGLFCHWKVAPKVRRSLAVQEYEQRVDL